MADITIIADSTSSIIERDGLWGPYWTSPSVGYVVTIESSSDIEVWKTTDSGATWTHQDVAGEPTGSQQRSMAVWFDQETPGNSGTIIHIAFVNSIINRIVYIAFKTSDDTYETSQSVDVLTISGTNTDTDVSITVSKSGRIYVCTRGDYEKDVEDTDHSMRSSSDGFVSNDESELSPYSSDEEVIKLFPGDAADEDDICAVVFDGVNRDIEFWKFDASANTWGKTAIDTDIGTNSIEARRFKGLFDAAIRHSDGNILVAYFNNWHDAAGDFKAVDISQATPTITSKTNLHTNIDDSAFPSILINQQNDDVYVAYAGSDAGDEDLDATVLCYFKKSTDGMANWGSEQTYGILNDDIKKTSLGRTIGNAGGRIMPTFFNQDLADILVNDGNDIEIAAFVQLVGTQINIGDAWKEVASIQINIGDAWKAVTLMKINVGDVWKTITI